MRFNEIKEIDTLMKCVPHVNEILGDTELFASLKDKTWFEAATPLYKAHKNSFDSLMAILDEKPESAVKTLTTVARIIAEIFKDEETAPFFMQACTNAQSVISAMANTEEKQSEDLSDT
jgi:hypothetical protein